jgi:hypothetical protein
MHKKLSWITHGQYTRSIEGRFTIVAYSRQSASDPISLTDRVTDSRYAFKTLKAAKAFSQERLTEELDRLSQPLRRLTN